MVKWGECSKDFKKPLEYSKILNGTKKFKLMLTITQDLLFETRRQNSLYIFPHNTFTCGGSFDFSMTEFHSFLSGIEFSFKTSVNWPKKIFLTHYFKKKHRTTPHITVFDVCDISCKKRNKKEYFCIICIQWAIKNNKSELLHGNNE